ncbi:MAG TPA: hypothetical protein VFI95_11910 [Terriglobales bacterium]|nr:hypothetical protein [Terriglobales bacterium]
MSNIFVGNLAFRIREADICALHLTPNGWVSGNRCYVGQVEEPKKEVPSGRVETWTEHTEQSSSLAQKDTIWKLTWKSEFVRDERRGALRDQFPRPG